MGETPSRSANPAGRALDPLGQQAFCRRGRHGEHDGVSLQGLVVAHVDRPGRISGHDRLDSGSAPDRRPEPTQLAAGRVAVQVLQGHPRPPQVTGSGVGEQPDLEHRGGHRQRRVVGSGVERRDPDRPRSGDRTGILAVVAQPVAKTWSRRPRPCRRSTLPMAFIASASRTPFGGRQRAVAQHCRCEVQRRGHPVAAQAVPPAGGGVDDRHVQAVLQGDLVGDAEAVEECQIGGAATQEDVLAVVDHQVSRG